MTKEILRLLKVANIGTLNSIAKQCFGHMLVIKTLQDLRWQLIVINIILEMKKFHFQVT